MDVSQWAVALEIVVIIAIAIIGGFIRIASKRADKIESKIDGLSAKMSANTRDIHDQLREFRDANGKEHQNAFERIARIEAKQEK